MELKLTDDKPVCIRPYYVSLPTLIKIKKIIQQWLEEATIEPSTNLWSSPAFLAPKDRLVVNYTELNKMLIGMNYSIGELQNMHQHLRSAKYFTVLNLNKAFFLGRKLKIYDILQYYVWKISDEESLCWFTSRQLCIM